MRRPDKNAPSDRLEELNTELSGKVQSLEQSLAGRIDALQQAADTQQQQVLSAISHVSASFESLRHVFEMQSAATGQILTASENVLQMSTELSSKESALEDTLLEKMQSVQQALIEEIQRQHSLLKISHISASLETLQHKFEDQSSSISQISSLSETVQRLLVQVEKLHAALSQRLPIVPSDGRPSLDTLRQTRDQRMTNATNAISEYRQSDEALQQAIEEHERNSRELHQKLAVAVMSITPGATKQQLDTRVIGQVEKVVELSPVNTEQTTTGADQRSDE
jgi:hypothetical protein